MRNRGYVLNLRNMKSVVIAGIISLSIFASCGENTGKKQSNLDLEFPEQEAIDLLFVPDTGWYEAQQRGEMETRSMGMKMHSTMEMNQRLYFGMGGADELYAEMVLEDVRMDMRSALKNMGGGVYNSKYPDSTSGTMVTVKSRMDSLIGKRVRFAMNTHGEVKTNAATDSLMNSLGEMMGNDYDVSWLYWAIPLPKGAVKPGDSWESETEKSTEMGTVKYSTTYTLMRYDTDSVFVRVESKGIMDKASKEFSGARLSVSDSGELVLSRKTGIVIESKRNSEVTVTLSLLGMEMETNVKTDSYTQVRKK